MLFNHLRAFLLKKVIDVPVHLNIPKTVIINQVFEYH